ncbi:hypothetical protein KP509_12G025900 [Ceratopteris richardii]|uniref:Uncharacterized protein n=1 Tax=Ceratopteris richardii TaxID=49495 RepID=A0A8T2TLW5_CERRI|nr:hypothetical protein KP509_12G025900 [Ceratopteris richardii]
MGKKGVAKHTTQDIGSSMEVLIEKKSPKYDEQFKDMESRIIDEKLYSKIDSIISCITMMTPFVNEVISSLITQFGNLDGTVHYELSSLKESMDNLSNHVKKITTFKTISYEISSVKESIDSLLNQVKEITTCKCNYEHQVQVQNISTHCIQQSPLPDHRRFTPSTLHRRTYRVHNRPIRCFWCDQISMQTKVGT